MVLIQRTDWVVNKYIFQLVKCVGFTLGGFSNIENVNHLLDQRIENTPDDELIYTGWTDRKETRIRDKYCKIKVRYSGEDLAIITALKTIYTASYA